MHPLESLLRSMGEDADDGPPDISTIGKVEILKDFAVRYIEFLSLPCPFKPGDFVTPRGDAPIKGKGAPHVVLETRVAAPLWLSDGSSSIQGRRLDMRVAERDQRDACIMLYWVESVHFERWTEEG